jgi:hypothetical protein
MGQHMWRSSSVNRKLQRHDSGGFRTGDLSTRGHLFCSTNVPAHIRQYGRIGLGLSPAHMCRYGRVFGTGETFSTVGRPVYASIWPPILGGTRAK